MLGKIPTQFWKQKQQACKQQLLNIRSLNDPIDQSLGYLSLLYDVFVFQGIYVNISDDSNVFKFDINGTRFLLFFWPTIRENVDKKLSAEAIETVVCTNDIDYFLACSLIGFENSLVVEYVLNSKKRILLLDGLDIDALCGLNWNFFDMLQFKQRELDLFGQPNVNYLAFIAKATNKQEKPPPYLISLDNWLQKEEEVGIPKLFREDTKVRWIDFLKGVPVEWPQLPAINASLQNNKNEVQIISGLAGTGKSTLLYQIGYRYMTDVQASAFYLNASLFRLDNIENIIYEIDELPENSLVLIDDLHQRPVLANKIIGAILSEKRNIKLVCASRPAYLSHKDEKLYGAFGWRDFTINVINLQAKEIVDDLIRRYALLNNLDLPEGYIQKLKRDVGQDLTILGWMLRNLTTEAKIPEKISCEEAVIKYRLSPLVNLAIQSEELDFGNAAEVLAILYVVTFFEQFDIRLKQDIFPLFGLSSNLASNLIKIGYLSSNNDYLGIGHANLARLYLNSIEKYKDHGWIDILTERMNIQSDTSPMANVKLALLDKYFKNRDVEARGRAMINVFEYFSPKIDMNPVHQEMTYTAGALERAMEMLLLYFQRDPSGENSVSNSAMMGQVFVKLGRVDLAKQALNFILMQQETDSNGNNKFVLDPLRVTTVRDFEQIKNVTEKEEKSPSEFTSQLLERVLGDKSRTPVSISEMTDFDNFHQTWLSATVLPLINLVEGNECDTFRRTLNTVLAGQDSRGWFYPEMFCWSTARCIINLVNVGIPTNLKIIQNAINWLLSIQLEDGRWHSPDWLWNPDAEMTAMCLVAIISGGRKEDLAVNKGLSWLLAQEANGTWNNNAHDTSHVIEVLNALDWPFEKLLRPLRFIEQRVSTDDWYRTVIGKERRQSLEIGELANVLLDVETKYLFSYVRDILAV